MALPRVSLTGTGVGAVVGLTVMGTTLLVTGDLDHAWESTGRPPQHQAAWDVHHINGVAVGQPPAPAPPHQPIRHRSRCRVHCCPAPRAALSRELPQDRKVARVSGLWRVHGGSLTHRRSQPRPHSCTFSHISLRHRSGPHRHATLAPPRQRRRRRESPDPGDAAENVYEV